MHYVMVPVPNEHVLDLMRWLQFRTEPENPAEDEARLRAMVAEAGDVERSILLLIASAAIAGSSVRLSDAVNLYEQDASALRATLLELGVKALGPGRTFVKVLSTAEVNERGRMGRVSYLAMRPHHARIVRSALRRRPAPRT